jgi:hypothetical protein
MILVMLVGVINSRRVISLQLIPYLECNQCTQHGLKNHFCHVVVDIHSFHCVISVQRLVHRFLSLTPTIAISLTDFPDWMVLCC